MFVRNISDKVENMANMENDISNVKQERFVYNSNPGKISNAEDGQNVRCLKNSSCVSEKLNIGGEDPKTSVTKDKPKKAKKRMFSSDGQKDNTKKPKKSQTKLKKQDGINNMASKPVMNSDGLSTDNPTQAASSSLMSTNPKDSSTDLGSKLPKKFYKNKKNLGIKLNFNCTVCPYTVDNGKQLAEHMWNLHKIAYMEDRFPLFHCPECPYRAHFEGKIAQHIWLRHKILYNEEKFPLIECGHEGCDYKAVVEKDVRNHRAKHLSYEERRKYICSVCGKCCTHPTTARHCEISHDEESYKFTCETCGKKFPIKFRLTQHVKNTHNKWFCHLCPKVLKQEKSLNQHLNAIHGVPLPEKHRKFSCDLCSYQSIYQAAYKQHRKTAHDDTMEKICHICFKSLKSEIGLKRHIKTVHENIPVAEIMHCTFEGCSYSSSNKSHLKAHFASRHTDEKPFACHLCSYRCKLEGNLRIHLRGTHKENVVTLKTLFDEFRQTGSGYDAIQEKLRELKQKPEHLVGLN